MFQVFWMAALLLNTAIYLRYVTVFITQCITGEGEAGIQTDAQYAKYFALELEQRQRIWPSCTAGCTEEPEHSTQ